MLAQHLKKEINDKLNCTGKVMAKLKFLGEKMYGNEVLLDRVFPLVRLTGQLAYVSRTKVFPTPLPMFAL